MEIQEQNQKKNVSQPVSEIETTAPGKLRVIKRNGKVVAFEDDKIKVAITKAFLAIESGNAAASERIHKKVNLLTESVVEVFKRRMPSGGTLHIEEIQDQVELQLMRSEELDVAKSYILYRAERSQERKNESVEINIPNAPSINITKNDGSLVPLDIEKVAGLINDACKDLEEVSVNEVLEEALKNLYDGVSIADMRTSLVMSARTKVEKEPNYSFVTARILMDQIRSEALNFLGVAEESTYPEMEKYYPKAF
ncbi:MAG: ATP cone domain-containing protein, partial [Gammaproteobacteria bacterium]